MEVKSTRLNCNRRLHIHTHYFVRGEYIKLFLSWINENMHVHDFSINVFLEVNSKNLIFLLVTIYDLDEPIFVRSLSLSNFFFGGGLLLFLRWGDVYTSFPMYHNYVTTPLFLDLINNVYIFFYQNVIRTI